jgi:hypothetical protein
MRFRVLFAVLTTAMLGATAAAQDDKSTPASAPGEPEKVLNSKGLTRDDRRFLLEGEKAAVEKYEEVLKLYKDFQSAQTKYAAILQYDEMVKEAEMERDAIQQQAVMLQQQINQSGSGYGRMRSFQNAQLAPARQQEAALKAQVAQINAQINASKAQAPKADDRKTVPAEYERSKTAYITGAGELGDLVTPLLAQYHELALDKSVSESIHKLQQSTKLNVKLGPSDKVLAAAKLVAEVKKATATPGSRKASSKKKAAAKAK